MIDLHERKHANRAAIRDLRKAILAHLKRYKRKCSSAQRFTVAHEREHVKRLPDEQIVTYARTRGPLIGFTLDEGSP